MGARKSRTGDNEIIAFLKSTERVYINLGVPSISAILSIGHPNQRKLITITTNVCLCFTDIVSWAVRSDIGILFFEFEL